MRPLIIAVVVAIMLAVTITPARVTGQPGETEYTGTHSAGGTIRFTVSATGARLTSLTLNDVSGGGCTWGSLDLGTWGGVIEIHDNAFSVTNADGDTLAGTFPAPFRAAGTVQVSDPAAGCTSGLLSWTASAPEPVRAAPPLSAPAIQPTPSGVAPAPALGVRDAPFCAPGQRPAFHPGLAALKLRLGDVMGVVLECEHLNNANGDTLQQTTTGLAYFRWATGLPTFTDGWRHWALSGDALIAWEGESPDPPGNR